MEKIQASNRQLELANRFEALPNVIRCNNGVIIERNTVEALELDSLIKDQIKIVE